MQTPVTITTSSKTRRYTHDAWHPYGWKVTFTQSYTFRLRGKIVATLRGMSEAVGANRAAAIANTNTGTDMATCPAVCHLPDTLHDQLSRAIYEHQTSVARQTAGRLAPFTKHIGGPLPANSKKRRWALARSAAELIAAGKLPKDHPTALALIADAPNKGREENPATLRRLAGLPG